MRIWKKCHGENCIQPLTASPWRVVEVQHISSTRDLVDTPEEHDMLEDLIEASKPLSFYDKHYLIFTPFRYPPLKYGSRFGSQHEPSLWYGSYVLHDAFTEVAYYRLQFFADTAADLGYIDMLMTAFRVYIDTARGVDLSKPPFDAYKPYISHPTDLGHSQQLGHDMRLAGVEAFVYVSARTRHVSHNVAVFTPDVFVKKKGEFFIENTQNWTCMANSKTIEFTRTDFLTKERLCFSVEDFA